MKILDCFNRTAARPQEDRKMRMTELLVQKAQKQFHNVCIKVQDDTFIVFSCEHTLYASWFIRGGYWVSLVGHIRGYDEQ